MQTKHTPGPWTAKWCRVPVSTGERDELEIRSGDHIITECFMNSSVSRQQCEANARLIAAAPDLLEALDIAIETIEHFVAETGQNFDNTLGHLRQTRAKATGKKEAV